MNPRLPLMFVSACLLLSGTLIPAQHEGPLRPKALSITGLLTAKY